MNADSHRLTIRAHDRDFRAWLGDAVVCPELEAQHILHLGIADMVSPYEVVRTQQSGAYFLACLSGEGRVLVDGRWRKICAGTGCLLPPRILNAFHISDAQRWEFCWIRYDAGAGSHALFQSASPVIAAFEALPLKAAITGLNVALCSTPLPMATQQWLGLIQTYVQHFSHSIQGDLRLRHLWQEVSTQLAANWTAEKLTEVAHLSFEQLRRLCLREIGRTPMNQVTHLRMQHAARQLAGTDMKIDAIAREVGFASGNTFAATFKKWIGWPPSEFRQSARNPSNDAHRDKPTG